MDLEARILEAFTEHTLKEAGLGVVYKNLQDSGHGHLIELEALPPPKEG